MSEPIDIKALDEYLKGGSDISQRYRELGREDVPPELDRRVLHEARAAVASGGGGRSRSWLRWSAPVALAASVVLVVTVVIESGVQDDTSFATKAVDEVHLVRESKLQDKPEQPPSSQRQFVPEEPAATVFQETPAAAPASPPPAALAKAEAERSSNVAREEARADARAKRDRSQAPLPVSADSSAIATQDPQLAAQQPTPSFAGSVATISAQKEVERAATEAEADSADHQLNEAVVAGSRVRRAPGRTAGPRNTISSSAVSSQTRPTADADAEKSNPAQSNPAQSDPDQWLEEIRDLRRAGEVVEADREWQRFRKAFPDFHVADDDIARQKP